MAGSRRKEPLYRKVNTRTHGVHHGSLRIADRKKHEDKKRRGMRQGLRHGLDYTPLYRFLLSKVGKSWDAVYSEAVSRLPDDEAIWWLVARSEVDQKGIVMTGESSYYSGLYVAEDGLLCKVDPDLKSSDMRPPCPCCTHTFNGDPFGLQFVYP